MNTPTIIDINDWSRKEHYLFFKDYDLPYFSITTHVDVTKLHKLTQQSGGSFFLSILYHSLKSINLIEEFRLRMEKDQVVLYDQVHAGATVLKEDKTFKYCFVEFQADFNVFIKKALDGIDRQKKEPGLTPMNRHDLVYYSSMPWVSFTGIQHARNFGSGNGVPMIVFGKHFEEGGVRKMPVSVDAHHALVDGYHVGRFFEEFQGLLDSVE